MGTAMVYGGEDLGSSYNLPPGVTINKVAGQPGMVTISNNNMGGAFMPNPNVYPGPPSAATQKPAVIPGKPSPAATPNTYGSSTSSSGNLNWNTSSGSSGGVEASNGYSSSLGSKDNNVIVVDTNNGLPSGSASTVKKEMTSEEKVVAAVKGIINVNDLNVTQKKKYKKMKKDIAAEKEKEEQKRREEDDLMDQMYNISKGKKGGKKTEDGSSKK